MFIWIFFWFYTDKKIIEDDFFVFSFLVKHCFSCSLTGEASCATQVFDIATGESCPADFILSLLQTYFL